MSDDEKKKLLQARLRTLQSTLLMEHTSPSSIIFKGLREQVAQFSGANRNLAECQFSDHHLAGALSKIDKGISDLMEKYPGRPRPKVQSGLRGPKYFIELAIAGKNVDAFSLILSTEKLIQKAKKTENARIVDTNSFTKADNVSYMIDFSVNSSSVSGGKSKGSVFIRGIKGENGYDSYKFVLEKMVDFAELDSQMILGAVEHLLKMQPDERQEKE